MKKTILLIAFILTLPLLSECQLNDSIQQCIRIYIGKIEQLAEQKLYYTEYNRYSDIFAGISFPYFTTKIVAFNKQKLDLSRIPAASLQNGSVRLPKADTLLKFEYHDEHASDFTLTFYYRHDSLVYARMKARGLGETDGYYQREEFYQAGAAISSRETYPANIYQFDSRTYYNLYKKGTHYLKQFKKSKQR